MAANNNNILYLFDRPTEPLFIEKDNSKVSFDVPPEYLIERYQPLATDLQNRFSNSNNTTIRINKLKTLPDLSYPMQLKRDAQFSLFNKYHCSMAANLIEKFMAMKTQDELLSLGAYCRDRINPYMFVYALSVVLIHKPETRNMQLPSHAELFPSLYMNSAVFSKAREELEVIQTGSRIPIEIPHDYSASNLDAEHRISYFREDIGINLHHWHWHLVYPYEGPMNIVNKDRRGELFYYMHQQIIARYNMERLCNNLNRVVRFVNWRDPIEEGYYPKLDNIVSSRVWPPRQPNARLSNINREVERMVFDIEDMERMRDRIFNAIHSGFIYDTAGKQVKLTEETGIDVLGNLVESSLLSLNPELYGTLHNYGHIAIAFIHDPDQRYQENFAIMGDTAINMRDPIFYRWHSYIDDIFHEYKATIPGYSVQNLTFENIKVSSLEVSATGIPRNEFATFWQQSDIDLSRGLDFSPRGSIFARSTHLQHAPFNYKFVVENSGNQRIGTVRIFIAPKFDERGLPFLLRDQRKLFVELDKFSVTLKRGKNEFTHSSLNSSVTIPHEQTYRNLDNNRPNASNTAQSEVFNFCGCGWPQNMLIAKGTPEGYQCQLFLMVSSGSIDQVVSDVVNGQTCDNAASYCGVRNARYPDTRHMGYPFDRYPRSGVVTLNQFLTPNMIVQDVRIRFTDRIVAPWQGSKTKQ